MAATGKKSKKIKGKTLGLSDFLGDRPIPLQTKNWAEDEEDYGTGGYANRTRLPVVLPSASRASRGGVYDDDTAPHYPPFMAYLSNLPYEVEDASIADLFPDLKVINLRLPRETEGRSKGFGYVEFEDRESLVAALNIGDLQLSGRRIKIDVAEGGDRKYGARRSDRDRDREYDPERTSGDWRAGPRQEPEGGARKSEWSGSFRRDDRDDGGADGGSSWRDAPPREPFGDRGPPERSFDRGGFGRDRDGDRGGFGRDRDGDRGGFGRDRDGDRSFSRDGDRGGFGRDRDGDRTFSRDGDRGGFGRDRDGDRSFSRDGDRGGFGRDRDGDRSFSRDGDRGGFGRDRDGDRGYGGDRYGPRREGGFGRSYGDRDERSDSNMIPDDSIPTTRPKLKLLPRTVPANPTPAGDGDRKEDGDVQKEHVDSPDSSRDGSESGRRAGSPERKPAYKPPVPASSIFGSAKPVDTAAREREIEERLRKKAEEMRLRDGPKPEREEGKWRDRKDDFVPSRSGDRLPYRSSRDSKEYRDSGDRDSRGYRGNSRDNRDYREKDGNDRGSGDRRENRDSRDSRDGGGDSRGSRDSSKDNRDNRESRPAARNPGIRDGKEAALKEGRKERNYEERPLPKAKDHEPPNFIAQNKFSQLENPDDEEVSE